jgi:putative SOS response-associated peptidase YedK
MPDEQVFTCAGIWRKSDEWGYVYSLIVTEASEQVPQVHDRMPVILPAEVREQWLTGTPADAATFCEPYHGRMMIEGTDQRWTPHH